MVVSVLHFFNLRQFTDFRVSTASISMAASLLAVMWWHSHNHHECVVIGPGTTCPREHKSIHPSSCPPHPHCTALVVFDAIVDTFLPYSVQVWSGCRSCRDDGIKTKYVQSATVTITVTVCHTYITDDQRSTSTHYVSAPQKVHSSFLNHCRIFFGSLFLL